MVTRWEDKQVLLHYQWCKTLYKSESWIRVSTHQRAEDGSKISFSSFKSSFKATRESLFLLQLREMNDDGTYFLNQSLDTYHLFLWGKELFVTLHHIHLNRPAYKECSKHKHPRWFRKWARQRILDTTMSNTLKLKVRKHRYKEINRISN